MPCNIPRIQPPAPVCRVLERLEACGFAAYVVGGCVRDSLLGRLPHDWDITTAALPAQVCACLHDLRVLETGLQHGTVTVLVENLSLEVTTFRVDGSYSDARHPDQVWFTTNLREDLARRDFTINAMAYSPRSGLADYFGGQADLAARCLRCVGDPATRFSEDALRMLRGLRFSAELGFPLEQSTAQALMSMAPRLSAVAAERIQAELSRLLCGSHVREVLLRFPTVLVQAVPALGWVNSAAEQTPISYRHLAHTVALTPARLPVRLAALLCHTSEQQAAAQLARLRYDRATATSAVRLVGRYAYHPCDPDGKPNRRKLLELLAQLGPDEAVDLLKLQHASRIAWGQVQADASAPLGDGDSPASNARFCGADIECPASAGKLSNGDADAAHSFVPDPALSLLQTLLAEGCCYSVQQLAIGGRDLLALGLPAGPEVGRILQAMLRDVWDGRCANQPDALIAAARGYIASV